MTTDLNVDPKILFYLEQIGRNARLNKHQHFHATERHHFNNNLFGSIAIVINVTLG